MNPLQKLLKKDAKFEWTDEGKYAFKSIKNTISRSPILISPYYSKEFWIFSFTLNYTITSDLLQKNKAGQEKPIAFMSRALQHSELKYTTMEKQAYALFKSLKHFRTYFGYSKIIGYVPHVALRDIMSQ